jgi:hypothetical protein
MHFCVACVYRVCDLLRELGSSGSDSRKLLPEKQGSDSTPPQQMAMAVCNALHRRGIIKAVLDNIHDILKSANKVHLPDVRETSSCMMRLACSLIQVGAIACALTAV